MYNLHYHIYRLPQPEIHKPGWYTFCLLNSADEGSLLLMDTTSGNVPDCAKEGLVFSIDSTQLPQQVNDNLKKFPLFYQKGNGPFPLASAQYNALECLFEKIKLNIDTPYIYKDLLLANLALQLLHFGIKNFTVSAV